MFWKKSGLNPGLAKQKPGFLTPEYESIKRLTSNLETNSKWIFLAFPRHFHFSNLLIFYDNFSCESSSANTFEKTLLWNKHCKMSVGQLAKGDFSQIQAKKKSWQVKPNWLRIVLPKSAHLTSPSLEQEGEDERSCCERQV